jgi:Skp family chaperone for outer membrane proteins
MKKLASLALLITLLLPTISFAQNSPSDKSPVDKSQVIQRLLSEIDARTEQVAALEERERKLTEEIEKTNAANKELTEAHKQSLLELGKLRATIEFRKAEIEDYKKQVELWRNEAQSVKKELKSSRKRELILFIGLIVRSLL